MDSGRKLVIGGMTVLSLAAMVPMVVVHAQEARRIATPSINPSAPIISVLRPPVAVVSETDQLRKRIDALEKRLADQQGQIVKLQQAQGAAPAGYTKAFITLANFSRLPPTEGISYWARN